MDPAVKTAVPHGIRGAWHPREYALGDGTTYRLEGTLFFGEVDWSAVLCVVETGSASWGAGLAGTYSLRDDRLVFTHRVTLSAGDPPPGVPAVSRLIRRDAGERQEECRIAIADGRLEIRFPTGNAMQFVRSGP